ncbi:MAG: rane protein [Bacteroidetes bacterium]|nr:rane protein [Bacteroidota bacterium]
MARTVIGNELVKTFRKWRSYIAFITIGIVVPLVFVAIKLQDESMAQGFVRGMARDFVVLGNILNGYFVTVFLMNSLWIHIPFLLTLAAGDQLAGEGTGGTFRLMLIRPVSRTSLLFTKYIVTLVYTAAVVFFLGAFSLGLGTLLFGTGDLFVPGRFIVILPEADAVLRIMLGFALATWAMFTVASLAFFFSSLVDNALGPIIATMATIIVFYVITGVPADLFVAVKPYLFTTHMDVWEKALRQPVDWADLGNSVAVLGAYSVGFLTLAWYIFVRKDILS